jgi:hypothetical protein
MNQETLRISPPLCQFKFVGQLLNLVLVRSRKRFLLTELAKPLFNYRNFGGESTGLKKFTRLGEYISVPEIAAVLGFMRFFRFDLRRAHSLLVCVPGYWPPRVAFQSRWVHQGGRSILRIGIEISAASKLNWVLTQESSRCLIVVSGAVVRCLQGIRHNVPDVVLRLINRRFGPSLLLCRSKRRRQPMTRNPQTL